MSQENFPSLLAKRKNTVLIHGSFSQLATECSVVSGVGFSVSWVSDGQYLVSLDQNYTSIDSVIVSSRTSQPNLSFISSCVAVSPVSGKNFTVYLYSINFGLIQNEDIDGVTIDFQVVGRK